MAGRSEEVLKVRVIAVLLHKIDDVMLRHWHAREAVVRDVPEDSGVMSCLAGARENRESFAVNVGHNAAPPGVGQDDGGAFLGILGGLSLRGVDRLLRRGVRTLQRHRGGNPVKAAESALFCVKCPVDGVEVTNVVRWIVKEYARGRRRRMAR